MNIPGRGRILWGRRPTLNPPPVPVANRAEGAIMAAEGRDFTVRPPVQHVTILDHINALLAARDRHYDRLYEDFRDRLAARDRYYDALLAEIDTRHQQRFDAQTQALKAALDAAETAVNAAMIAAEKAVSKAELATEKRFESVNEFRSQLADQANTFMPRSESEQRLSSLAEKLDMISTMAMKSAGRSAGMSAGWAYLLGAAGLISLIVGLLGRG